MSVACMNPTLNLRAERDEQRGEINRGQSRRMSKEGFLYKYSYAQVLGEASEGEVRT